MRISFLKNVANESLQALQKRKNGTKLLSKATLSDVFVSSKKTLKKKSLVQKLSSKASEKFRQIINSFDIKSKEISQYTSKYASQKEVELLNDVMRRRGYNLKSLSKALKGQVKIDDEILTRLEFKDINKFKNITLDNFKDLKLEDRKEFINQYISTLGYPSRSQIKGLPDIPLFKSLKKIPNNDISKMDFERHKLLDSLMENIPRGKKEIQNFPLKLNFATGHIVKPPLTNSIKNIKTDEVILHGHKIKIGDLPNDKNFYVHNMVQDDLTRLEALLLTDSNAVLCTGFKGGNGYLKGSDRMGVIVSPKTTKDLLVQAPNDISSGYGAERNLFSVEKKYLKAGNMDNEYIPNIIKGELNLSDSQYSERMQKIIDSNAKYLDDVEKIDPELYDLAKNIPQDYQMFEGIMRPDIEAIYLPKDMEITERIARFAHEYNIPILRSETLPSTNTAQMIKNTNKYYVKPETILAPGIIRAGDL